MKNEGLSSSLLPYFCGTTVLICIFGVEGILRFFPHPAGEIDAAQSAPQRNSRSSWSGDSRQGSFKLLNAPDYSILWSQEGLYDIFFSHWAFIRLL